MNEYINFGRMQGEIFELLKAKRDSYAEGESQIVVDFLDENYSDEYLVELAYYKTEEFNSDMKRYLHRDEHRLCGNFNNIDYDYDRELFLASDGKYGKDEIEWNCEGVEAMTKRLDENDQSELAVFERDALTGWFWSTFGTFGLEYNFGSELADALYMLETEEECAVA